MNEKKTLRDFGLVLGAVFMAIGLLPLIKGDTVKLWAAIIGTALTLLGLAIPRVLKWPYKAWMKVGHFLMLINTRLILTLIYFVVVCPIGILLRFMGKDILLLRKTAVTYWLAKNNDASAENYRRQF